MRPSFFAPLVLLLPCVVYAQQPVPQPDTRVDIPRTNAPEPPAIPLQFNMNFKGTWTGTLETPARPGSGAAPAAGQTPAAGQMPAAGQNAANTSPSAANTRRPSLLVMRPSPDGRAINFDIDTFDPGTTAGVATADNSVKEREILSFTDTTAILTGTSTAQNQAFRVQGMAAFAKTGYGTLVFTGPGKQDDVAVDLRMTLTLTPGSFTWLRESRPAGSQAKFKFLREFRFTRSNADPS